MGIAYNPRIITDGLMLALDSGNLKSYDKFENLFLYSEEYNQSNWIKTSSSLTTDTVVAPDGSLTAEKLIGNNGVTGRQSIYQQVNVTSGVTYTFSVFLKQAERRYGCIWFDSANITEGAFWGAGTYFDLQTGTIALGSQTKIVAYPNGWYRLYVTATPSFTGLLSLNTSIGTPNNSLDGAGTAAYQYTGDGVSGFYIWGSQFEGGNSLTNYCKTTSSVKNRSTTWNDSRGNGNNGTLTNSPTYLNDNGGIIDFNGSTNYADITSSALNLGVGSIELWVKSDAPTDNLNQQIFARTNTSAGTFNIFKNTTNLFQFSIRLTTNTQYNIGSDGTATTNWTHIVGTYDGTIQRMFVNAVQQSTTNSISGTLNISGTLAINIARQTTGTVYFNGKIPIVRVYNKALTAQEIQQNFNATRKRFDV